MQAVNQQQIMDRVVGVVRLDAAAYEDIERDKSAMSQAAIVVVIAALAGGIGALGADGFKSFIAALIGGIVGWIAYSYAVYFVGTKWLSTAATEADSGQVLRTMGFAQAPHILSVVGFIPILGPLLSLVGGIWVIVTSVVAIRQSLEMNTGRAVATAIVAGICYLIVAIIIGAIFGAAIYSM